MKYYSLPTSRKIRCLLSVFLGLVVVCSTVLAQGPKGESIKIGYSIVASDPAGQPALKGARLAVDEINAAGGILGRPLELVVSYNATKNYAKVPGIINGLIDKGVSCIITSGGSAMTMKAAEITIPKGVLIMTASSSSPKISLLADNDLVWRTIPADVFQGKLAARWFDSLKHKRVSVIHVDNAYGNGLATVFQREFKKLKGKILSVENYPEWAEYKNADFTPLLKKLYKDKPDAIYMITYGEDGAQIVNQSVKKGYLGGSYKPLLFGCDANYNNDLAIGVESNRYLEGMRGLVYTHPKNYPNFDKFIAKYTNYLPTEDSADVANASLASLLNVEATAAYAATAYDAVYTLGFAITKANSAKPKDIAANLRSISKANKEAELVNVNEFAKGVNLLKQGKVINYDGASGMLEFDDNGDVTSGTYNIWTIKGGNFSEDGFMEAGISANFPALPSSSAPQTLHIPKLPSGSMKIGVCIGASDPSGISWLRSVRMATEEINAQGGIGGKPLEIVVAYTETGNYTKSTAVIQTLVDKGVSAILSGGGSANTLKAAEVTIPRNILLVTPSSTSPKISQLNDHNLVWRTISSDIFQGHLAARVLDSLKHKTVGIVFIDNAYGNGLAKAFRLEFEHRRGKVVSEISYPDMPDYTNFNFKPILDKLYQSKPTAVYIITYNDDGVKITTQSKVYFEAGYKPLLFGCDGNYNSEFLLGADVNVIEGMTGLAYIHPLNNANYEKFIAKFKKFTPIIADSEELNNSTLATLLDIESTNSYAATAYDAVYVLVYAALKANSTEPIKIAAHIHDVSNAHKGAEIINVNEFSKASMALKLGKSINYEGVSGAIEFDKNGDVTSGTYMIWRVIQGKFVESGTIAFP